VSVCPSPNRTCESHIAYTMDEVPLFKSSKRRKLARPRDREIKKDESATHSVSGDQPLVTVRTDTSDDERPGSTGLSGVIKARTVRRPTGGVQFSTAKATLDNHDDASLALQKLDVDGVQMIDIGSRFVGSTGHVVNDDKHMFVFPIYALNVILTAG
jgi:hypothetical protein